MHAFDGWPVLSVDLAVQVMSESILNFVMMSRLMFSDKLIFFISANGAIIFGFLQIKPENDWL